VLAPSHGLVRILGPIVPPSHALAAVLDCKNLDPRAVWSQVVGAQALNKSIPVEELARQLQRRVLVSLGLDRHIENLAPSVDGQP
jgi:hypothetical protein